VTLAVLPAAPEFGATLVTLREVSLVAVTSHIRAV
jgi:hypothetical protein